MHKPFYMAELQREQCVKCEKSVLYTGRHTNISEWGALEMAQGSLTDLCWLVNVGFSWGPTGPQSLHQFSTSKHPPLDTEEGDIDCSSENYGCHLKNNRNNLLTVLATLNRRPHLSYQDYQIPKNTCCRATWELWMKVWVEAAGACFY